MFRFIVCDDDIAFCRKEKQLIADFYGKQKIDVKIDMFHSGEEIIRLGERASSYDVIFLDVNMEKVNGIDLGSWLNAVSPQIIIVFVSDSIRYAPDGYRVGAVRYIMKDEKQFESSMGECLSYILQKLQEDGTNYIAIDNEKIRVSVDKILYVESKAHKITYYLVENGNTKTDYTVYGKLGDAEQRLKDFGFRRVHQSYLVNMNYAKDVKRYRVVLLNQMEICISKRYYKTVEDEFIRARGTV